VKKLKLLLLDANVVITLHELGLWDKVADRCDLHIAGTVIDHEALFFRNKSGDRQPIDLSHEVTSGKITRFDLDASQISVFRGRFRPGYFDVLDPGESESLAYLLISKLEFNICSGDKIVYRVLGALLMSDRGVSLEEILHMIGESRQVSHEYTKTYREHWSNAGFRDGIQGMA